MNAHPIVDQLCLITTKASGVADNEDLRSRISEIVWEHGLLTPPTWMMEFFALLANGVDERTEILIPPGYPEGENGIANILADIDADVARIGIDDWGEGWQLDVPSLGVSAYVSREHGQQDLAVLAPYNKNG